MKLVLLFGDAAVGKMTVGQELMKITKLRLFHNHMTIEPIIEVFGEYRGDTIQRIREVIFEDFAQSDNYGMIFTYMWAFDRQTDWDYVAHVVDIFKSQGAEIYYVELVSPLDVRLKRNRTANRLQHKPSKRDISFSEKLIEDASRKYRLVSNVGEITFPNYVRIDNSELEPETVAAMIRDRFRL